jgi:signal peptidase I
MGRRTLSFVHGLLRYWKPNPRIPGGSRDLFHRSHRLQLAYRFLALTALCLLVENDDVSPFSLDMSQGPSMLPTFASIGDVFLRETGAWYRFLGIPITYQRGDLVVFRDENGCYAGKRIIGVAGDEVMLYGEYVHLYLSWPNWAINTSVTDRVATHLKTTDGRDARQRIMVPPGHVWLEGDCPPFSRDSRHYGPISVDRIRGRILYRIWPWQGELITRNRPHPLTIEEALSGKYNLFPIRRHH